MKALRLTLVATCLASWAGCTCLQPVEEWSDAGDVVDAGLPGDAGPAPADGGLDAGAADAGDTDAGVVTVVLEASRDRLDGVLLSWSAGQASTLGFRVERDGVPLGSVDATANAFLDTTAGEGVLAAPPGVVASDKEKDGIALSWDASAATAGEAHRYVVLAQLAGGEWLASNEALGQRGPPTPDVYEVQRLDAGTIAVTPALTAFEQGAGGWSLDASVDITVQPDDFRTTVVLSADASIALERFPAEYRVRAMQGDGGAASPWSDVAVGRRTDELYVAWQWQRASGPDDAGFADLPRVMGPRWFDPYPVLDATRAYRLALRVERLGEVLSPARSATLYRPLKLALGNEGRPLPALCILRSDQSLLCRSAGQAAAPGYVTWDAGADIVELAGSPRLVCGRRTDGGVDCWGTEVVQPSFGPVQQISVDGDSVTVNVCGLKSSGEAVCFDGAAGTPDGGWLSFGVQGAGTTLTTFGIRRRDRAFEVIGPAWQPWKSYERQGPYAQVDFPHPASQSPSPVGLLMDGGIDWFVNVANSYELPAAAVGYREVHAHGNATCGVRNDGFAVCRGTAHWVGRTSTNVEYRAFAFVPSQACGITTDDHVECWDDRYTNGGVLLPPRMPIRDLYAGDQSRWAPLKFVDTNGRFFELAGGPLPGATPTPDDSYAALPRMYGVSVTLVRPDGGVAQWPTASVPPGTWAKVDRNCGLAASGHVECQGWAPAGVFQDVAGGDRPCGLRLDGSIECATGMPQLPAPGPYVQIVAGMGGELCAQRADRSVVCEHIGSISQRVAQFDVWQDRLCGVLEDGGVQCVARPAAPPLPQAPPGPYRKVSAGNYYACGLRTDDTAVCWSTSPVGVPLP